MTSTIRISESVAILETANKTHLVVYTSTRKTREFNFDNLILDILEKTRDDKIVDTLVEELSKKYEKNNIEKAITTLEHFGILRLRAEHINKRYKRQLQFIDELTPSWIETVEKQKKLEDATVTIFGVGGIGTWIVNGLHQIGIGKLRIVEPDKVEESNLNRQLYFSSDDIGLYKVDVLKKKLTDSKIEIHKMKITEESDLENLIKDSTFLVNCADQPSVSETTRIIDKHAQKQKIPYCVSGGYNLHLGMVGPIIVPGKTATFDDFLEYQKAQDPLRDFKKIKDVEQSGNLGPIAGAISNIQVMEIFKHLTGLGKPNYNKFAEINFMDFSVEWRYFGSSL